TWTSPPVAVGAGPPGVGGGKAGGGVEAGEDAGPEPVVAPMPPLVPGGVLVVSGGAAGRGSRAGAPLGEPAEPPSEDTSFAPRRNRPTSRPAPAARSTKVPGLRRAKLSTSCSTSPGSRSSNQPATLPVTSPARLTRSLA